MTVSKKDVQDFFKRLRYYSPKKPKIKYYAAAEYGSDTKRPHYHIILFNADPKNIDVAWGMGSVYYGTVSAASVGYSLKYISKKGSIPIHSRDDRLPEFSLMSKKLGANYLTPAMIEWHESDIENRMYLNIEGGKKISMPRYYKDQIYTIEQREHIGAKLAVKMEEKLKLDISQYKGDYYRDKAESELAAQRRREYRNRKTDKI